MLLSPHLAIHLANAAVLCFGFGTVAGLCVFGYYAVKQWRKGRGDEE